MIEISQLFVYPIKSLKGISLETTVVQPQGFQYDRNWMLTTADGVFLTQRQEPKLCLMQTAITDDGILVSHEGQSLLVPFQPQTQHKELIKVWDNAVACIEVSEAVNDWFSAQLGYRVVLWAQDPDQKRMIDPKYAQNNEYTSLADAYPILVISEESLNNLNSKLEQTISIQRFRPNLVVKGVAPHFEDQWEHVTIGGLQLKGVKSCARCAMIGIDPVTAQTSKEPTQTLASYRATNNKILFGENLLVLNTGTLQVGQEVQVLTTKTAQI